MAARSGNDLDVRMRAVDDTITVIRACVAGDYAGADQVIADTADAGYLAGCLAYFTSAILAQLSEGLRERVIETARDAIRDDVLDGHLASGPKLRAVPPPAPGA